MNTRDGALFIATHTGLWRVADGAAKAERVTDRRQDTMGFTVVGPDRFLGSGHPDLRDGLPPHLGLIESRDAGQTWQSVSLLGEADFHVLRSRGRWVYGFDATNTRLLISRDGGRTWREAGVPGELLDLAVDPRRSDRLVASARHSLFASADAGDTWKPLDADSGLLAWPAARRLYRVGADGRVAVSPDGGRTWRGVGAVPSQPAALLARSARELFVALHDGSILRSRDGGRSWRLRSRP